MVYTPVPAVRRQRGTPRIISAVSRRAGWTTLTLLLSLLALGCVEVRQQEVVTPGAVPEELRGARWQSLAVEYCVVVDDRGFVPSERFVDLTKQAFDRWGRQATYGGLCPKGAEGDGRNQVSWGSPEDATGNHPEGSAYQVGWTSLIFRGCPSGCPGGAETELIEADILILSTPPGEFQNEECLFAALLHEAGHFLGVQHLNPPAVMAPASDGCAQQLTPADIEALETLYR